MFKKMSMYFIEIAQVFFEIASFVLISSCF